MPDKLNEKLSLAYKKIRSAKNILLAIHNNPDGDACSSICALIDLLESLDIPYKAFCFDRPPEQYGFLPHIEKISSDMDGLDMDGFDLFITLDCGQLSRTKLEDKIEKRREKLFVIEFDHHPKVHDYADIEIRKMNASSTAEIIYDFFHANKIKMNKERASCILTGILTDTGNLLYDSTSDDTVKIASKMMLFGAKYPAILEKTWRNKSLAAMKIWGLAMSSLAINKKYDFAYTVISRKEIADSGATEEELEGISGFISNLKGVKGLMILRESEDGCIKGNLRSNYPNMDISKLAARLGGGGHPKASGFTIPGRLERAENGWRVV